MFLRTLKYLGLAIALLICCFSGWWFSASLRGQLAARFDVARGRYLLQTYGLPVPWINEEGRILRQRYGIQMEAVAGCVVSPPLVNYVDAYDDYVVAAANRRFGRDVFKESREEAERNWKLQSDTNLQNPN